MIDILYVTHLKEICQCNVDIKSRVEVAAFLHTKCITRVTSVVFFTKNARKGKQI